MSGPQGLKNCVASDTFMHECCARFSLETCPHLHFVRHERRDASKPLGDALNDHLAIREKPPYLLLIRADRWRVIRNGGATLVNFRPVATQRYTYQDGTLVQTDHEWQPQPAAVNWKKPTQ